MIPQTYIYADDPLTKKTQYFKIQMTKIYQSCQRDFLLLQAKVAVPPMMQPIDCRSLYFNLSGQSVGRPVGLFFCSESPQRSNNKKLFLRISSTL